MHLNLLIINNIKYKKMQYKNILFYKSNELQKLKIIPVKILKNYKSEYNDGELWFGFVNYRCDQRDFIIQINLCTFA